MIELKPDTPVKATLVKGGSNHKGDWELIKVQEEKGRKAITIWVDNPPSGVKEGGSFRIDEIKTVTYKSRLVNNKWYDEINVHATVSPLSNTWGEASKFDEVPAGDDYLPF